MSTSMPRLLVECLGLRLGALTVPTFQLLSGQAVRVLIPASYSRELSDAIALFSRKASSPQLQLYGEAVQLERPSSSHPMPISMLFAPSALGWLVGKSGLSRSAARLFLESQGITPSCPVYKLGWNERTLLGFEAARHSGASILVIDSVGNCPALLTRLYRYFFESTRDTAMVDISFQSEWRAPSFEGKVVEVVARVIDPEVDNK